MSAKTTGEMVVWCNMMILRLAATLDDMKAYGGAPVDIKEAEAQIDMLGAIRDRLLQASGKSEPHPDFEAAPDNVVQGNFGKDAT